mmetsp:Transcript_18297/g.50180  ORF Transcript_18297/g.50180 Transcript_18297/m.50180 type:complete len:374 (-) Transcript_18297:662-1783(-)
MRMPSCRFTPQASLNFDFVGAGWVLWGKASGLATVAAGATVLDRSSGGVDGATVVPGRLSCTDCGLPSSFPNKCLGGGPFGCDGVGLRYSFSRFLMSSSTFSGVTPIFSKFATWSALLNFVLNEASCCLMSLGSFNFAIWARIFSSNWCTMFFAAGGGADGGCGGDGAGGGVAGGVALGAGAGGCAGDDGGSEAESDDDDESDASLSASLADSASEEGAASSSSIGGGTFSFFRFASTISLIISAFSSHSSKTAESTPSSLATFVNATNLSFSRSRIQASSSATFFFFASAAAFSAWLCSFAFAAFASSFADFAAPSLSPSALSLCDFLCFFAGAPSPSAAALTSVAADCSSGCNGNSASSDSFTEASMTRIP